MLLIAVHLVCGAPLLIYPFVVLAFAMGLAGGVTPGTSVSAMIASFGFYILAILYPVPLWLSVVLPWSTYKSSHRWVRLSIASIPIAYLLIVAAPLVFFV